jgi:hypothetical protein
MNIEELCERSYKTAVDKGWHTEPRSFGEVTALFHSEVSEALEIWRDPSGRHPRYRKLDEVWESEGGKPEGFVIELADLLIRIADTCVEMKFPLAAELGNMSVPELGHEMALDVAVAKEMADSKASYPQSIPEWLARIHACLSRAFEDFADAWGTSRGERAAIMLARAIEMAGAVCWINGLDLEAALARKMAYNDDRSYRHGGKRG